MQGFKFPGMPSASSPPMVPLPNTSARDPTGFPVPRIAKRGRNDSRSGRNGGYSHGRIRAVQRAVLPPLRLAMASA